MPSPKRPSDLPRILVTLALVVYAVQGYAAIRSKSATFDEPAHIGAGLSYLETREFKINLQHPPLLKEIAAVPLVLTGVTWPMSEAQWKEVGNPPDPSVQWYVGNEILYGNGADKVLFETRLPFLVLSLLLILVVFLWGQEMLGPWPAALGALMTALDPTLQAHGVLVTTDTGFALAAMLFTWSLWRFLMHRTVPRLVTTGATLGLALGAKFTGALLVPVGLALLLAAERWIPAGPPKPGRRADPFAVEDRAARVTGILGAFTIVLLVAGLVLHALYFFSSDPFLWFKGILRVNSDHDPSYWPYMAGGFKPHFWTYYVVTWLLKEPLPVIGLVLGGLFVLFRRDTEVTALDRAFLVLPPAAILVFYTFFSHNLGFRYLIPMLPFLHLVAGFAAAWLWRSGGAVRRAMVPLLLVWLGINGYGIAPDPLAFFNESACLWTHPSRVGIDAGAACGVEWLDDSNVDWGQGLKQLKTWLDANAPNRHVALAYFGTARPDAYGIDFERVGSAMLERRPPPGLYAISAHLLARANGALRARHGEGPENWIAHTPPTAVVGHAFYVYDLKP
ncbi:MAG TPA: glycosyltransferase family 39 protein [Candidatus Polarisedimenticolia bacterium]|nr:glycosyltransferase family 39 protein [Candidatus Polarisedimenticolia bacterium]